jgi:hypothetical protein
MPPRRIAVCLEVTPKQAVASALDWPGWCRAGRDEQAALEALADYATRQVAIAGIPAQLLLCQREGRVRCVPGVGGFALLSPLPHDRSAFPGRNRSFM